MTGPFRSTFLLAALAGCARPPLEAPAARPSLPSLASAGEELPAGAAARCRMLVGGAPTPTLTRLMSESVNADLSQLSMLLFHDERPLDDPARNEEAAALAMNISACFRAVPALYRHGDPDRADFDLFAALQSHNASALADAALQQDRTATLHWFQHVKETCHSCHERYRFAPGRAP